MNELAANARRLRFATLLVLALACGLTLAAAIAALDDPAHSIEQGLAVDRPAAQWAALLVGIATTPLFVAARVRLVRVLRCIEAGWPFAREAVGHLRAFAGWVFVASLAPLVLPTMANLGLRLLVDTADRLSIVLEDGDLFLPLFSGLLYIIARLVGQAQAVADENRQII